MRTVKARITASRIHPGGVSIRDRNGRDIRRALEQAGFELGELVTIQTDDDAPARNITQHAMIYGCKAPISEEPFINEMRLLLMHLNRSLPNTDDRRGAFDLEITVRVKRQAQSKKGETE